MKKKKELRDKGPRNNQTPGGKAQAPKAQTRNTPVGKTQAPKAQTRNTPVGKAQAPKAQTRNTPVGKAQTPKAQDKTAGFSHPDYDAAVLDCFLKKQLQLFPEQVASTPEEAADFLEMCFAVVAKSKKEVRSYFEEVGTDFEGEDLFSASEVFPVGDGRYLIVEG